MTGSWAAVDTVVAAKVDASGIASMRNWLFLLFCYGFGWLREVIDHDASDTLLRVVFCGLHVSSLSCISEARQYRRDGSTLRFLDPLQRNNV